MADISSITLPGGGTYDLKDKNAVPKYGMGKNLLDNWYFLNPVNRRGVTSVTQRNVFTIDAWKTRDASYPGSVSVTQNGLVIVSSNNTGEWVEQKIPSTGLVGKSLTLSALTPDGLFTGIVAAFPSTGTALSVATSNGTVVCEWSGGNLVVSCRAAVTKTETYIAVKLELGSEQTLCHNEGTDANPVWVLNEIPDYEEELIKCQTSTADPSDIYANNSLATEQQLAYVETGTTASRAYAVGEYFCWNGLLYRVTAAISSGAAFTVGTNCEQKTEGGFNAILPAITDGTVTAEKASGFVQTFSVAGLYFTYFKITTSVVTSTSDVLATVPAAYSPLLRALPVEFLYQRPTDSAPIIRGDRAGIWLDTNGEIMQRLSNGWPANTLMQGLFIYTK